MTFPSLADVRHFVAVLAGVALVWVALGGAYDSFRLDRTLIGSLAFFGALLAVGIGLILNRRWPRRIAAFLACLFAIFLPVGYFNPFHAMDLPPPPPTISELLSWMVPAILGLLAFAWLVDPPRGKKRPE